jgi:hypothetical protein
VALKNFSVALQVAAEITVDVKAENFEQALAEGREMVRTHRAAEHMLKRGMTKGDGAVQIQDIEAHLIRVCDDDAGMMYR